MNLFKDSLLLPVGQGRTWIKVIAYNNDTSIDIARYESCPDQDPVNTEDHWAERQYGFAINEAEFLDISANADAIKERIAIAKATVAQEGVNKKQHMSNLVKQSAQARAKNFETTRQRYLATQKRPALFGSEGVTAASVAPAQSQTSPSRYYDGAFSIVNGA